MQIYFFTAGTESSEFNELERRIRSTVPSLRKLTNLDAVIGARSQDGASANHDQICIIIPVLTGTSFDRMANLAAQEHRDIFFIFVSNEISASDYKRLVRGGGADWVSIQGAPQEILDIISRTSRTDVRASRDEQVRPAIVAFVPSTGGVGNATLAIETAVQIKRAKQTRARRVCLLDLDLRASHICDYLDIEPRFHIEEIVQNPDRLDAQLFDLFVSRHAASGIDVLAVPRNRRASVELDMAALDTLFRFISQQYDLVIINVPPAWFDWTDQILGVSAASDCRDSTRGQTCRARSASNRCCPQPMRVRSGRGGRAPAACESGSWQPNGRLYSRGRRCRQSQPQHGHSHFDHTPLQ